MVFLENSSTEAAAANLLQYTYQALNSKKHAIAVFIDLTEAFDIVDHQMLLEYLQQFGIRSAFLNYIWTYFTGRQQRIRVV